jgi:hypothetical protein
MAVAVRFKREADEQHAAAVATQMQADQDMAKNAAAAAEVQARRLSLEAEREAYQAEVAAWEIRGLSSAAAPPPPEGVFSGGGAPTPEKPRTSPPALGGRLHVRLRRAKALLVADLGGSSDPYCLLALGPEDRVKALDVPKKAFKLKAGGGDEPKWQRTEVKKECVDPSWEEDFVIDVPPHAPLSHARLPARKRDLCLHVRLMDWERYSADDPLGDVALDLAEVFGEGWARPEPVKLTVDVTDPRGVVPEKFVMARTRQLCTERMAELRRHGGASLERIYGQLELEVHFTPHSPTETTAADTTKMQSVWGASGNETRGKTVASEAELRAAVAQGGDAVVRAGATIELGSSTLP